jgi:carbon dioxide concentrating mechanism protein CcmN
MNTSMRSPSLPLIHDAHFFISGDVTIHPTAAIAPGVLLQADPGCQLTIAAGTSIGIGSILHAHQGSLVVEAGVTLGSGVLIVGSGIIGANACIGSTATIFNRSIEPHQSVAAGALLGDESRQIDLVEQVGEFVDSGAPQTSTNAKASAPNSTPETPQPETSQPGTSQESAASDAVPPTGKTQVVYGRAYLEKIMVTMFPYRQAEGEQTEDKPPG